MSLLPSKNDTLRLARKSWQKFERLFENKKLLIHKKYINKFMRTKIAHLVVKKIVFHFRKFIGFSLTKTDFFCFLEM
jgi:hypothetical protein